MNYLLQLALIIGSCLAGEEPDLSEPIDYDKYDDLSPPIPPLCIDDEISYDFCSRSI